MCDPLLAVEKALDAGMDPGLISRVFLAPSVKIADLPRRPVAYMVDTKQAEQDGLIGGTLGPLARGEATVHFRATNILPSGWQVTSVGTGGVPYGYLKEKDLGGLTIHLTGSEKVADKGKHRTTESLTLWFMPITYRGAPVPPPGTPHMPARFVGKTSRFKLYVLLWNATPTWQNWKADLLRHYSIKPDSNKELKATSKPAP